jgi:hypothetical protein
MRLASTNTVGCWIASCFSTLAARETLPNPISRCIRAALRCAFGRLAAGMTAQCPAPAFVSSSDSSSGLPCSICLSRARVGRIAGVGVKDLSRQAKGEVEGNRHGLLVFAEYVFQEAVDEAGA